MQNMQKKVGIFILVLALLAVGYWYSQSSSSSGVALNERDAERAELAQANDILKSLQSKAIGTLTDNNLAALVATAGKVEARIIKYEKYRTDDKADLKTLLVTKYKVTVANYDLILETALASPADYLNGDDRMLVPDILSIAAATALIEPKIVGLTKVADLAKFKELMKEINDNTADIVLHTTFLNAYNLIEGLLCKTDDTTNDPAKKGTVTMHIGSAKHVDSCKVGAPNTVVQYVCQNNKLKIDTATKKPAPTETICPNGCLDGTCKGGNISALSTVTMSGEVKTNIKTADPFYLKSAVSGAIGETFVAALSAPAGCTNTTNTIDVTATTTEVKFGPINCTTVGSKLFKVDLKEDTKILKTENLTVAIAANVAESLTITTPNSITANTPTTVTVTVIGGNGQTFTGFNKKVDISVLGDIGVDHPPEATSFTNGIATISNVIFSRATEPDEKFTIKIQTEDRTLKAEKEVTVTAPTATHTWNS
jgi:hypothetical protein